MKLERYELKSGEELTVFEFVSEGYRGKKHKIIQYSATNIEGVVATVYAFTDKHRHAWIYATGSTVSRTRLYRMGISRYLDEIEKDFYVFGETENEWVKFERNINYQGFIVKRK